jgi:hypothetical protein
VRDAALSVHDARRAGHSSTSTSKCVTAPSAFQPGHDDAHSHARVKQVCLPCGCGAAGRYDVLVVALTLLNSAIEEKLCSKRRVLTVKVVDHLAKHCPMTLQQLEELNIPGFGK